MPFRVASAGFAFPGANGAAASFFDRLRMKLSFAVDAMKNLPHAELVEARTTVMHSIFQHGNPFFHTL
jgi:hypothetical protein